MNKIGFEPRTRFETVDFCNSTLQNSLEKLLKEMGFDYAGIWLPNGNGYMPMYEAGITTFLKSSTCSEQIRAAGVSESPLFKCPTDSTE